MSKNQQEIKISSEYITLGQLLKFANIVSSGVEAKFYLTENEVKVNETIDNRRGRKLRPGDVITLKEGVIKIK